MLVKLGEIADIQFGFYDKPQQEGVVKYLNAGHFDSFLQPSKFEDSYIELTDRNSKFLLQSNDVILAGKGYRTFAWAYDTDFGQVIPSSLFYIIRIHFTDVLGSYLAYYLNSDRIQYKLKLIGSGATITSIPKKELQNIVVNVPSYQQQLEIVKLIELMEKDVELTRDLLNGKVELKKGIVNELIKEK